MWRRKGNHRLEVLEGPRLKADFGIGRLNGLEILDLRWERIQKEKEVQDLVCDASISRYSDKKGYRGSKFTDYEREMKRRKKDCRYFYKVRYKRERQNEMRPLAVHIARSVSDRFAHFIYTNRTELIFANKAKSGMHYGYMNYEIGSPAIEITRNSFIYHRLRGAPFEVPFPPMAARKTFVDVRHPVGLLATSTEYPGVLMNWTYMGLFQRSKKVPCQPGELLRFKGQWEPQAYSIRGVAVPNWVVEKPYTAKEALKIVNVEVRRVALERLPLEQVIEEGALRLTSKTEAGELYKEAPVGWDSVMSLAFVKVLNSTPEPDGSFKTYWLRVPPAVKNVQQAIAWTFGLDASQYKPVVET